jgi:O-antigen/teichoic acid export membrane protein
MRLKQTLIFNTLFSALPRVSGAITGFFIVPITISYLGIDGFGIWAIMNSFATYLFILDFGFNISIVQEVAASPSTKKNDELHGFITIVFCVYLVVITPLLFIFFLFKETLCSFFHIPLFFSLSCFFMCCSCLIGGLTSLFCSVFNGMQKFHFTSVIQLLSLCLSTFGIVIILHNGYGIVEIAEYTLVCNVIIFLIAFGIFIYLVPSFKIKLLNTSTLIPFFKKSLQFYVTSLCSFVVLRSDMFLIAAILGPVAVGYYRIAASLALLVRDIPEFLTPALFPAATFLHSTKENDKFLSLLERALRYIFLLSLSLIGFIIFYSTSILQFWIGQKENFESVLILQLLSIAFFCNIITGPSAIFARASSLQKIEMYANIAMTFLHLTLNLILLNYLGYAGMGWATIIAIGIIDIMLLLYLNARFNYSLSRFFSNIISPATLLVFISTSISFIFFYFSTLICSTNLNNMRLQLGIPLLISGVVYVISLLWGSFRFRLIEASLVYDFYKSIRFPLSSTLHSIFARKTSS